MSCELICKTSSTPTTSPRPKTQNPQRPHPYEFICKAWTSQPLTISPLQQTPGLNRYTAPEAILVVLLLFGKPRSAAARALRADADHKRLRQPEHKLLYSEVETAVAG